MNFTRKHLTYVRYDCPCHLGHLLIDARGKFAPNKAVRQEVEEAKERYHRLFGEPTDEQKMYSRFFCDIVEQRIEKLKEPPGNDPFDPPVRQRP